jgi:FKBP-type peptidyl-prolyl cis-trans isomerase
MRVTFMASVTAAFLVAGEALAVGDISPQANREFLAANTANPDFVKLPSGLRYRVIKSGTGRTPAPTDTVTVAYKGTLVDGFVFDETEAGETANLPVGRLIAGWREALSLMKEGDEWELVIPAELGYGRNRSGDIPGNQTLIFNMHLIRVLTPDARRALPPPQAGQD